MSDPIEALFLNQLHHPLLAGIELKLDRMHRLLSMLGSPHKRLPPVIHVAGTNGKGSLLAYLQAILETAGYRVHKYTSPHLIRFSERIILRGTEIDNAYAQAILKYVTPVLAAQPATFFEATTAAAFLAFAEKPADVLLLETGMGGRLDATNVIEKPLLAAITPVAMDHMEYLGDTLAKIAGEKAGILKRNTPCVVGRQMPESLMVIEKQAGEVSAPLYRMGYEWSQENGHYQSQKRTLRFTPSLAGDFQCDNAATAIACIDQLPQFNISEAQITEGIAKAVWPARLQKLTHGIFTDILPTGIELWLDGGHNPQGGEALANWLRIQPNKQRHLVCGMMERKDAGQYFAALAPYVHSMQTVSIPGESKSQTAEKLAALAQEAGIAAMPAPSVEKALQTIAGHAKTPALVCICGSLYLAGKILAAMEKSNAAHY